MEKPLEHRSHPVFQAGEIVTVFRSQRTAQAEDEYQQTADQMLALARTMPGFVDFKSFVADDGERVSIVTFADAESQRGWRDHVEHRGAQAAGRDRFYSEYSIQVCVCDGARDFKAVPRT